jgi:hypothetical protein
VARPKGPKEHKTGWVWAKDPKPELLATLPRRVRTKGIALLRSHLPRITQTVVSRIRARGVVVRDGREVPIPPYSEAYHRRLKKEGRSTVPDYSRTGRMLDSTRGRMKVAGNDITGIVSVRGRIAGKEREGTGKKAGKVWREPYSYTNKRTGATVDVKGQWIRRRGTKDDQEAVARKTLFYNQHLLNLLVSRRGRGKWNGNKIATHHILAMTTRELEAVLATLSKGIYTDIRTLIRQVAGN